MVTSRPKDAVLSRISDKVMPEVCAIVDDFDDEMEATDWLNMIKKRAWFKRRYLARHPKATGTHPTALTNLFPRGVRFASDRSWQRCTTEVEASHAYMALDPDKQNPLEVLHILAHNLQAPEGPWHGADFSQTYFDLVERAFDKDVRRQVREVFLKHKIKTRSASEATREKHRDLLLNRQAASARDEAREMLRELKQLERKHGRDR